MPANRDQFSRDRIVMRPSSRILHALVELGRYNLTAAKSALPGHKHRNAFEICFLVRGRQTYRVRNELFSLRGGDVFITFPDEIHSTDGLPEEKGILYWMLLARPAPGESFLGLPPRESAGLLAALPNIARRHFRGSCKMKEHLDAITSLHHKPGSALRSCGIANHAVSFLLEVIECGNKAQTSSPPGRPLERVIEHIQTHLDEPLGIPELARRAGLSEPRFKVHFKEVTGIPPGEYVQRARIEEAQRRLSGGAEPVTTIAFDLGFSTSQYFATVFKRYTGKSPGEARKNGGSGRSGLSRQRRGRESR